MVCLGIYLVSQGLYGVARNTWHGVPWYLYSIPSTPNCLLQSRGLTPLTKHGIIGGQKLNYYVGNTKKNSFFTLLRQYSNLFSFSTKTG